MNLLKCSNRMKYLVPKIAFYSGVEQLEKNDNIIDLKL